MLLNEDEKKEVERRVHRSADFQRVFSEPDGERVLSELDKFCGFKDDTFKPDPYVSAYNAGRRSVAIFIHNVIEQDIEKAKEALKNASSQER